MPKVYIFMQIFGICFIEWIDYGSICRLEGKNDMDNDEYYYETEFLWKTDSIIRGRIL